ncbi:MAG: HAMP domain-containing histidine kinase [Ruminococcus sp.]|nr:HAMP domain-containing histidine kinase [Ruminococcus sp.]
MKIFKKAKREKFWWIFLKSEAVALALACVFAVGFQSYIHYVVNNQVEQALDDEMIAQQNYISNCASKDLSHEEVIQLIDSRLSMYTHFEVWLDQLPLFDPSGHHNVLLVPQYSKGCHAVSALVDEDGNIVASSRQNLLIFLMFEKNREDDKERSFYICDNEKLNIPEVDEFFELYDKLGGNDKVNTYISIKADSIYINKKEKTFIPHKGTFIIEKYNPKGFFKEQNQYYITENEEVTEETKGFEININDPDFELTDVHQGITGDEYPRYALFGFWGDKKEVLDRFDSEFSAPNSDDSNYSYLLNSDGTAVFARNTNITIDKQKYRLMSRFTINYYEPSLVRYFWTYTILVASLLFIIALLYSWRRNVVNKAKYAMDDYQRDLTNNLAHDIKTPLTAIGGYAENILEGSLTEDEKQKYLHSILDNVAATDTMISKTLQLNSENSSKLRRERINVSECLDSAVKKYEVQLEEKNIKLNSSGSAEIKTNRTSFDSIIENLISNAVKYTSENGTIKTELNKKRLVITNTVASKIDVKKLKDPFVRGDASRSNVQGSGLGLTIAERAAQMNGMKLNISCSDSEFKSELKF